PKTVSSQGFRTELTTYPVPATIDNRLPCTPDSPLRILYSGVNLDNGTVYHLVDCNRIVGWVREEGILGPVTIRASERALTLETEGSFGSLKIEAADPPYDPDNSFRPQFYCKVNDIVDVIAITGFSTGELYYKIRCANPFNPVAPNLGWTTPEKLFGPVRFRSQETGLVPNDTGEITLFSEAGNQGEEVASCTASERVTITETPVQRILDDLFYEISCGDTVGWVNQNVLVGPLLYEPGELILVAAPVQSLSESPTLEATQEAAATEEPPPAGLTVSLTTDPAPPNPENEAGQCADGTLAPIEEIVGIEGLLYLRIQCGDIEGWLSQEFVYGPAAYAVGDTVQLGEKAVLGFNERGIYLSLEIKEIEGKSGGSSVIAGECAYDLTNPEPVPAQILDTGYLRNALLQVSGIFYRISCQDKDGSTIEGWIKQDRLGVE
ncbi:MAG: hypothetical protein K8I82_12785, partial [Anaerolineae bacterium]|nr:hypothetical protein [Anaerolineae bacterium]